MKAAKRRCEWLGSVLRYAEAGLEAHGSRGGSGARRLRGALANFTGPALGEAGAAHAGLREARAECAREEAAAPAGVGRSRTGAGKARRGWARSG